MFRIMVWLLTSSLQLKGSLLRPCQHALRLWNLQRAQDVNTRARWASFDTEWRVALSKSDSFFHSRAVEARPEVELGSRTLAAMYRAQCTNRRIINRAEPRTAQCEQESESPRVKSTLHHMSVSGNTDKGPVFPAGATMSTWEVLYASLACQHTSSIDVT